MHTNSVLFLASSMDKVIEKFISVLNLNPKQNKVAFVENAAIPYGNPSELFWVINDKKAFIETGFQLETFDFTQFSLSELEIKLSQFQVIHFCGGNTLYLNYLLHQTGFATLVQQKVLAGNIIYTSTSAGSMIASPDLFGIKDALTEEIDISFLTGIQRKDYKGLNLAPFLIIPHSNNLDFIQSNTTLMQKLPTYPYPLIFSYETLKLF